MHIFDLLSNTGLQGSKGKGHWTQQKKRRITQVDILRSKDQTNSLLGNVGRSAIYYLLYQYNI